MALPVDTDPKILVQNARKLLEDSPPKTSKKRVIMKKAKGAEKPPSNKAERAFWEFARENGWQAVKRGWPDFACFKNGSLVLVEVKPKRATPLKEEQEQIISALAKHGIECYRWSPDSGMVKL